MRYVKQQSEGCAIASVAMLADVPFEKAVKRFYPKRKPYDYFIEPVSNNQVLRVMRSFGLKFKQYSVDWKKNKIFRMPKNPSLFTVDWEDYPNLVHCAVWDPSTKKFLDPAFGENGADPIDHYVKFATDYIEVYGRT